MKKTLLATTAVLGLAAAPGIAHANLDYTILTDVNATGVNALALQANPDGFAAALIAPHAPAIIRTGTNDTLLFNSGPNNLLSAFLSTAQFTVPLVTTDVMSNGANTDTTAIKITETYTGVPNPLFSQLVHDDGATIWNATAAGVAIGTAPICGTPQPQSVGPGELCTFPTGPGPHSINLYYEESFGAPAVLTVTLPAETVPAPEPASLALLGSALIGFGVWRRRRRAG